MRRSLEEIGFAPGLAPAATSSDRDEFVVEVEAPGYDEKELSIEVSDHTLAVKGSHSGDKEEKRKEFALHERLEHQSSVGGGFPATGRHRAV